MLKYSVSRGLRCVYIYRTNRSMREAEEVYKRGYYSGTYYYPQRIPTYLHTYLHTIRLDVYIHTYSRYAEARYVWSAIRGAMLSVLYGIVPAHGIELQQPQTRCGVVFWQLKKKRKEKGKEKRKKKKKSGPEWYIPSQ